MTQLASESHKTAQPTGQQHHHQRPDRAVPNCCHLLGHPGQETAAQFGNHGAGQGQNPSEQQQGATYDHRKQCHHQQEKLPALGVVYWQEIGLGQALQLRQLTAKSLEGVHGAGRIRSLSRARGQPGGQASGRPPITCTCR